MEEEAESRKRPVSELRFVVVVCVRARACVKELYFSYIRVDLPSCFHQFPQSTSTFMDFVKESVDPASEWRDFQSLQDSMSRESTAMSHEFSSETASLNSIDSGLSAAKTPQTQ